MLISGVGSSGSVSSTSGGKVLAFNAISTVPQTVLNIGAERVTISFHNPGTQTLYVAPLIVVPYVAPGTSAQGVALVPSLVALGGCYQLVPGGLLTFTGECQMGWQEFAAQNANNPLTVMVSHI